MNYGIFVIGLLVIFPGYVFAGVVEDGDRLGVPVGSVAGELAPLAARRPDRVALNTFAREVDPGCACGVDLDFCGPPAGVGEGAALLGG